MQLYSFNCTECNPTVFNPEFHNKCEYCETYHYKRRQLERKNNKNAKRIISFMKDTHTLQEIADYLNNEGLVSSRGGKFYPSTIKNLLK